MAKPVDRKWRPKDPVLKTTCALRNGRRVVISPSDTGYHTYVVRPLEGGGILGTLIASEVRLIVEAARCGYRAIVNGNEYHLLPKDPVGREYLRSGRIFESDYS